MFWKIDMNDIPSRGYAYDSAAEIRIRPLNIRDMKFLATINARNCTQIINALLQDVMQLTNVAFDDILLCDRMYFCFWLRANSFITHNGYTFNITCEHCKKQYEHEITLSDFDTRYIYHLPGKVRLPGSNTTLKLKIPAIKDLAFSFPLNDDLEKIGRCIENMDTDARKQFLTNLEALDYAFLMGKIKDLDSGFEDLFTFNCPSCGMPQDFKIKISDDGMFTGINLYDILKRIVSITKYTSMQLSDETPWMEMEIYVDVVNKMIEEENEANAKQQSLANNKLSGLKSSNNIQKPNIQKPNIHR